jgi:hypothetical protein
MVGSTRVEAPALVLTARVFWVVAELMKEVRIPGSECGSHGRVGDDQN